MALAIRLFLSACLALTALGAAWAEKGPNAAGPNPRSTMRRARTLRASTLGQIGRAELSIDMAAYVLSDPRIIEALTDAAERGVLIGFIWTDRNSPSTDPHAGGSSKRSSPTLMSPRGSKARAFQCI